ncbi:hypothetical protein NDU88_002020 [Pleurodeles waltl]|uniref:Uncharacterized protein n=1 Tax=Pleurodeles waltl TaxID=8319 RepID=A0AAV7P7K5_PLEWA|nr:hypothetical protein NDU88_002020 [Pleurodeles waltl]
MAAVSIQSGIIPSYSSCPVLPDPGPIRDQSIVFFLSRARRFRSYRELAAPRYLVRSYRYLSVSPSISVFCVQFAAPGLLDGSAHTPRYSAVHNPSRLYSGLTAAPQGLSWVSSSSHPRSAVSLADPSSVVPAPDPHSLLPSPGVSSSPATTLRSEITRSILREWCCCTVPNSSSPSDTHSLTGIVQHPVPHAKEYANIA